MDIFKEILAGSFKPVLKKEKFGKSGNKWNKTIDPLIYVVHLHKAILTEEENDFRFVITFGITLTGLHELTYGHTLKFYNTAHCMCLKEPRDIGFHRNVWDTLHFTDTEDWIIETGNFLQQYLIPFFNKKKTIADVLSDIPQRVFENKKENAMTLLKVAGAYVLDGRKNEGIHLLEEVIHAYNGNFNFARKALERVKQF